MPEKCFPPGMRESLPYKYAESIRVLGLQLDQKLCFEEHIMNVLSKANIRHEIMARLAKSTWGLEAGIMRTTHKALLSSLTGYGLVVYGSGASTGRDARECFSKKDHRDLAFSETTSPTHGRRNTFNA